MQPIAIYSHFFYFRNWPCNYGWEQFNLQIGDEKEQLAKNKKYFGHGFGFYITG